MSPASYLDGFLGIKVSGTLVGAGFVVTSNGLIVTCSHVIQGVENCPPNDLDITVFSPYVSQGRSDWHVELVTTYARGKEESQEAAGNNKPDIVFLRFKDDLPAGVNPVSLGLAVGSQGHPFETRGFPEHTYSSWAAGTGSVTGLIPDGGSLHLQLDSTNITSGFSGAPVFDLQTNRVIGMVQSIQPADRLGKMGDVVNAIPTEMLQQACPELQTSREAPYRKLSPFTEEDARFYYGRDREIALLLEKLKGEKRCLAVFGPSGSGKTSLIAAGLIPQLRKNAIPGSEQWKIAVTTPANQPFQQLEKLGLENPRAGLVEAITKWLTEHSAYTRFMLVLDQFEELLIHNDPGVRQDFFHQLTLLLQADVPATVLISMRDDFYSNLAAESSPLMEILLKNIMNIPAALNEQDLREMVERPARSVGLRFEAGLLSAIINDTIEASPVTRRRSAAHCSVLPLLQFALYELWFRCPDGLLTRQAYEDAGRVTGSLTGWADTVVEERKIDPDQPKVVQFIFTQLVHLGDKSKAILDIKQQKTVAEIVSKSPVSPEKTLKILDHLIQSRLLVATRGNEQGGQETVEIVHDALLREWGRLQEWVNQYRAFGQWQQFVEQKANQWYDTCPEAAERRDEGRLLRGKELESAEDWLKQRVHPLAAVTDEFICASQQYRERQAASERQREEKGRRLNQRIVAGLIFGLVTTILLAVWAVNASVQTQKEGNRRATSEVIALQNAATAIAAEQKAQSSAATAESNASESARMAEIAAANESAAIREAEISHSLAVAASAQTAYGNHNPDLAVALALASVQIPDPPLQAQKVLAEVALAPGTRWKSDTETGMFRLAFSPDGKWIAAGSDLGDVELWDSETGKLIRRLGDHGSYSSGVKPMTVGITFTPDGKTVISAGGDDVRFWDVETGQELRRINLLDESGEPTGMATAVFHFEKGIMLWGSMNGSIHLWDLNKGLETINFQPGYQGRVNTVAMSSDGSMGAACADDETIRVWDLASGSEIHQIKSDQSIAHYRSGKMWGCVFSPDGKLLAANQVGGLVQVWDVRSGQEVRRFTASGNMHMMAFDPTGQWLAAGDSVDLSIRVWDILNGQETHRFMGHSKFIYSIAYHPDGQKLVSGSNDNTVRLWDLSQSTINQKFLGHTEKVSAVSFSPDGKKIVTSSWDGSVRVWDAASGEEIQRYKSAGLNVTREAISPEGDRILANNGNQLVMLDANTMQEIWSFTNRYSGILSMGFIPGGETVFSVTTSPGPSREGAMFLHNRETGKEEYRLWDKGEVWTAFSGAVSQDGKIAAIGASHGTYLPNAPALSLWDLTQKTKLFDVPEIHSVLVMSLAFSPDGQQLLVGCTDHLIRLVDVTSGKVTRLIEGHKGVVMALAFHPDGKTFISASLDGTVLQWDAQTGQEIRSFTSGGGAVWSAAISPDGETIAAGTDTGEVDLWTTSPALEALTGWIAQNRYVRDLTCLEQKQYLNKPVCESPAENGGAAPEPATTPVPAEQVPQAVAVRATLPAGEISASVKGVYQDAATLWSFPGKAGDQVSVVVQSDRFDPYLTLKDERGKLLLTNDDLLPAGSNDAGFRDYTLPADGVYTLIVDSFVYNFENNLGPRPFEISLSIRRAGSIQVVDVEPQEAGKFGVNFVEDAYTGYQVARIVYQGGGGEKAGLQPGDILLEVNGSDTSRMTGREFWNELRMPLGGVLHLKIQRSTETLELAMEASQPSSGGPLKNHGTLIRMGEKHINPAGLHPGESDFWQFEGKAGQVVSVIVGGLSAPLTDLQLTSPSGTLLPVEGEINREAGVLLWPWNSAALGIPLPETGIYTIQVTSLSKPAEPDLYTLEVQEIQPSGEMTDGETKQGQMPLRSGLHWSFTGKARQIVNIRLTLKDSLVEPMLFLVGPDQKVVNVYTPLALDKLTLAFDAEANRDVHFNRLLPADGEYQLFLLPFIRQVPVPEEHAGSFTLDLSMEELSILQEISAGMTVEGSLPVGEMQYFQYQGHKGEQITIRLDARQPVQIVGAESYQDAISSGFYDPLVYILQPDFQILDFSDEIGDETTNAVLEGLELPEDGVYIIVVSSYESLTGGEYVLTVR